MKHFNHEHPLILNEVYIAKEGDVCCGCREKIVSCRSFVYTCSINTSSSTDSKSSSSSSCVEFLLHKSCAELPLTIKHPDNNHHDVSLYLYSSPEFYLQFSCNICDYDSRSPEFIYDTSLDVGPVPVCIRCAMASLEKEKEDRIYHQHPAHPQHPLEFVDHLSSFKCHACKVDDSIRDLSYRCTKCSRFWIHKSCADAPASFQFQFHKHPLQLSFSLPQIYEKFEQFCRICGKHMRHKCREWLYYCPKCRFFAHFHCARSNIDKIRLIEDEILNDSEVVHLPAADESSADQLAEKFVMAMSTTTITTTNNCFRHWAHQEHNLQLMTINEYLNKHQKHDEEALLLCDGCVKPIRTDHQDNQFYGCVPCNYFMHNACAGLPREIEHHLHPGITLYAHKYSSPLDYFYCGGCGIPTNGIAFHDGKKPLSRYYNSVHIGCLTLPKKIKHEAHSHQLNQVFIDEYYCNACGEYSNRNYKYYCEKCVYYICAYCIIQPKTGKHPWDPHPLSLIYDPGMVSSDHEHEFECEYCSEEINTNRWFYHCSECDLSFHLQYECFEWSRQSVFSSIKYGATVIIDKLHHHSLTFVLNKKVRRCEKCSSDERSRPVLECVLCKVIFCMRCAREHFGS